MTEKKEEQEPMFKDYWEIDEVGPGEDGKLWETELEVMREELENLGLDTSHLSNQEFVKSMLNLLKAFLDTGLANNLIAEAMEKGMEEG